MNNLQDIKTPFSAKEWRASSGRPYWHDELSPRPNRLGRNQQKVLAMMRSRVGWDRSMLRGGWSYRTWLSIKNAIIRHNQGLCLDDCPIPDNKVIVAIPIGPRGGKIWVAVAPDAIIRECESVSNELREFAERWLFLIAHEGVTEKAIDQTAADPSHEWNLSSNDIKDTFVKVLQEYYWHNRKKNR